MKLRITHVEGSKKGAVENLDVPMVTVGRDPANTLAFDPVKDDRVSTKHAVLSEQGGTLIVTDLGSRNGTFVNGQKISAPTPVPPGALIQFGDSGPMISVTLESAPAPAASAPAAAPAPAKKSGGGGKGCLAVLAVLGLLVIGGAVGGYMLFVKFKAVAEKAEAQIEKQTGKSGESGKPADEKPAETAKPAETKVQNPWLKFGVGSSFTSASDMHMDKPVMDMHTEIKYTIASKTDDAAHIKMETTTAGTTTPSEFDAKTMAATETKETKPVDQKDESVTVPAGTFSCHYTKTTVDKTTTETWMSDDLPVPVKSVTTTDTMKSTMTLTKVDKK